MPGVIDQDKWGGVCGFVSVIHGLRQRGPISGLKWGRKKKIAKSVELTTDDLEAQLGAEMAAYLKWVQLERPAIAAAIELFTQTWGGGYLKKTLNAIINDIETTVRTKHATGTWKDDGAIGVALPPEAVEDYLDFVGLKHKRVLDGKRMPFTKQAMGKYKDCVVGTGASGKLGNGYNGLRHWVYVTKNGVMYNWAEKTTMGDSVAPPYDPARTAVQHDMIVYAIQLL